MFGIGSTELLVILVVALIVLGPRSLASVSRSLGKAMGEFRRVSTDFQRSLNVEAAEAEAAERRKAARAKAAAESASAAADKPNVADGETVFDTVSPPADSPLAQAIAKAKAEAEKKSPGESNGA